MLKGILTSLLSKETQAKGYELSEDEDFVYLYQHGKLNRTWSIKSGVTIQDIEYIIRG
jgi:hypothetical protein